MKRILITARIFLPMLLLLPACNSEPGSYPQKEWERMTPEEAGMSSSALMKAVDYLEEHSGRDGVEELVIVRNGYLVLAGDSAGKVHRVWSMTKSFTSTVLGLLIDDGKCTINTMAKDYIPGLKDNYPEVTLRHFATMTSGYRAMGDEPRGDYRHGPSLTPFRPDPEPLFSPGRKFAYWDSAMNEFANVLTQIAGRPLEHLFAERIAVPIGLQDRDWHWGDLGDFAGLKINSGAGNHTSMEISSLAMARLGHLFLHKGEWEGRQLISRSWIEQATTVQVPSEVPLAGYIDHGPGTYGYNWWVNGKDPGGNLKWPDISPAAYSASGYNNNDMFVVPEWDMVIVRLGLDQEDHQITDDEYNRFLFLVGQSIID